MVRLDASESGREEDAPIACGGSDPTGEPPPLKLHSLTTDHWQQVLSGLCLGIFAVATQKTTRPESLRSTLSSPIRLRPLLAVFHKPRGQMGSETTSSHPGLSTASCSHLLSSGGEAAAGLSRNGKGGSSPTKKKYA